MDGNTMAICLITIAIAALVVWKIAYDLPDSVMETVQYKIPAQTWFTARDVASFGHNSFMISYVLAEMKSEGLVEVRFPELEENMDVRFYETVVEAVERVTDEQEYRYCGGGTPKRNKQRWKLGFSVTVTV